MKIVTTVIELATSPRLVNSETPVCTFLIREGGQYMSAAIRGESAIVATKMLREKSKAFVHGTLETYQETPTLLIGEITFLDEKNGLAPVSW